MKKNKKMMVVLGIVLTGALTVGVISSFANDSLTSQLNKIKVNTEINNQGVEEEVLVKVGSNKITNIEFLNYKEYNSISPSKLTDSEILEHMIKEELFLQLAEKEGVSATLEEGRQETQKNREILREQPKEVQDTHKKFMDASGFTEEEYWEKIAPPMYQDMLSKQNIADKILKGEASSQKDTSVDDKDVVLNLKEFKQQLFEKSLSDGTVKVVANNISLD